MSKSIGHIAESRFYASLEFQPIDYGHKRWIRLGKTYNGTIAGVVARIGKHILIAHIRSERALQ